MVVVVVEVEVVVVVVVVVVVLRLYGVCCISSIGVLDACSATRTRKRLDREMQTTLLTRGVRFGRERLLSSRITCISTWRRALHIWHALRMWRLRSIREYLHLKLVLRRVSDSLQITLTLSQNSSRRTAL